MIKVEQFMDIMHLNKQGLSIRAIARTTGHSRATVRKVLRGLHTLTIKPHLHASKLDAFKDYILDRYEAYQLSAVRLIQEVRTMGYTGSLRTLRRFLQQRKQASTYQKKATLRFETPPGQQAQADWGEVGRFKTPEGHSLAVYVFVIVLSFSRMMFIRFTTSMKLPALIECHQRAFEFFGGLPQTLLYDNMKQVRLSPGQWNEAFFDFARHYGFTPKTHRPYRPRTKGKVERMVDYVKDNFLAGRTFEDLTDLEAQGRHWLDHTANVRLHGTTRQRPVDLLAQELLSPLAAIPAYVHHPKVPRKAGWDAKVHFEGSRYSLPAAYSGQSVWVQSACGKIYIHSKNLLIAEHPQAAHKGQDIVQKSHLDELWKLVDRQCAKPVESPRCRILFTPQVQQPVLQTYEQVAQ